MARIDRYSLLIADESRDRVKKGCFWCAVDSLI
jgi:hypothetical protein